MVEKEYWNLPTAAAAPHLENKSLSNFIMGQAFFSTICSQQFERYLRGRVLRNLNFLHPIMGLIKSLSDLVSVF